MIYIIPWLQELLPFVHQNISFFALWEYAIFATAGASMFLEHIDSFFKNVYM